MRDEHYRNLCTKPEAYDMVIDLIIKHNPYANGIDPEEFATEAVHSCIRGVVYAGVDDYSTAGCTAIKSENFGQRKARLAFEP